MEGRGEKVGRRMEIQKNERGGQSISNLQLVNVWLCAKTRYG